MLGAFSEEKGEKWYMPSTAVPAAVQASFAFLSVSFVESRGTAPEKISLG